MCLYSSILWISYIFIPVHQTISIKSVNQNLKIGNVCVLYRFQFLLLHSFYFFSSYNPLYSVILRLIKVLKIFVSKTSLRISFASNNMLHILYTETRKTQLEKTPTEKGGKCELIFSMFCSAFLKSLVGFPSQHLLRLRFGSLPSMIP